MRLFWPKIVEGDLPMDADCDWFYYCEVQGAMVSLPPSYVPVVEGEDEFDKW
jgi:hypothetical protein